LRLDLRVEKTLCAKETKERRQCVVVDGSKTFKPLGTSRTLVKTCFDGVCRMLKSVLSCTAQICLSRAKEVRER